MKHQFILLVSLLFIVTAQAQKLTGLWYSTDSTRVYEIKQTGDNKYEAIIQSSSRNTDSVGYIVIKNLEYNDRHKRYEGTIYAVTDGRAVSLKIKFDKSDPNKIILKLNRMFVLDVAINWIRAAV